MQCSVEPKKLENVTNNNILTQDPLWAQIKKNQGIEPRAFEIEVSEELLRVKGDNTNTFKEDLLVYIHRISKNASFAYIPYGPNLIPEDEYYGVFLETLSEQIKQHLPKDCIFVRFDLPWENLWSKEEEFYDEKQFWKGPPENKIQEYRLNWNTEKGQLYKSRTDILPTNTFFIDLKKSQDEILAEMKAKTRYNIRLSKRKGVEIETCGLEMLDTWHDLYTETALRNNIQLQDKAFFKGVLEANETEGKSEVQLLIAKYKGDVLAAMIFVISNKRATYLFGASTSKNREVMAPYRLQWEAVLKAKQAGCEEYDMFGTSPHPYDSHPMSGLFRFKNGFGAKLFHRMGCWDYPYLQADYTMYRAKEIQMSSFHQN